MREYKIDVPDTRLAALHDRVASFPWGAMPRVEGWRAGASRPFLRELATYWSDAFSWREQEAKLNAYPQFLAKVDDLALHFYHVKSPLASARPLLLLHGWPGSVFEFLHLIGPLTDPQAHGGDPADAFHVVIPSLPGYGFSEHPPAPIGPAVVAELLAKLMTDVLGYDGYISQGGDWGAIISTLIGFQDRDHCRGLHLNMLLPAIGQAPVGAEEEAWEERHREALLVEGAYAQIQMTKPQSLGFAMTDSPLGVAAWIVEKFASWSDLPRTAAGDPDLLARYSFDQLLTNIMLYLATDSFVTSTWLYHGFAETAHALPFARGEKCPAPTGVAAFPDPVFAPQPRSMAERNYNVVRWTEMPHGGHFAALEAPALFLHDLRAFGRML